MPRADSDTCRALQDSQTTFQQEAFFTLCLSLISKPFALKSGACCMEAHIIFHLTDSSQLAILRAHEPNQTTQKYNLHAYKTAQCDLYHTSNGLGALPVVAKPRPSLSILNRSSENQNVIGPQILYCLFLLAHSRHEDACQIDCAFVAYA